MKLIQMTLDDELIDELDIEVQKLGTTRSSFVSEALRKTLHYYYELELEKQQVEGYKNRPVKPGEFDRWQDEQAWID